MLAAERTFRIRVSGIALLFALLFAFWLPAPAQAQCAGICINIQPAAGPSGGGGGEGASEPNVSDVNVQINGGDDCTTSGLVRVQIQASSAHYFLIGDDAEFPNPNWQLFEPDLTPAPFETEWGTVVYTMTRTWAFESSLGEKTIYVKLRNRDGRQTRVYEDTIALAASCDNVMPPGSVSNGPLTGPSPITGEMQDIEFVGVGEFVKGSLPTVYYYGETNTRRPFIDEQTYYTYQPSFLAVREVTDASLPRLPVGGVMLPKEGVVLVKIPYDPRVFWTQRNIENEERPIIRWIVSEEVAAANFGADWASYVVDVQPTQFSRYIFGSPMTAYEALDTSALLRRDQLHEGGWGSGETIVTQQGFLSRAASFIANLISDIF